MSETAREWLVSNGYSEEANKIDLVINSWKQKKKKTRRNWWAVIAGTKSGDSITVEGVEFSVIREARTRMGLTPSKLSISSPSDQSAPEIEKQNRWKKNKRKSKKNHF